MARRAWVVSAIRRVFRCGGRGGWWVFIFSGVVGVVAAVGGSGGSGGGVDVGGGDGGR